MTEGYVGDEGKIIHWLGRRDLQHGVGVHTIDWQTFRQMGVAGHPEVILRVEDVLQRDECDRGPLLGPFRSVELIAAIPVSYFGGDHLIVQRRAVFAGRTCAHGCLRLSRGRR